MPKIREIVTVTPDFSINDVLQRMQSNFIKHIIIKVKNKPVGIVTERDINKFLEKDKTARALDEISIDHVMEKNIHTVTSNESDCLNQAAKLMNIFKIGSVIVVDSNDEITGIITKADITKLYGIVYNAKFKVKDYMSHKVMTCRKSDSLRFALDVINQNEISRLIVTNNHGKPIGVITTNDFLTNSSYFKNNKTRTRDYLLSDESKNTCVGDIVNEEVLTINYDDDLSIAAQKMTKNHISGIPVVDELDKMVGVVSNFDVVTAFVKIPLTDELVQKYSELY